MDLLHRKSSLLSVLLLGTVSGAALWQASSPDQPNYGGKRLSAWLDELVAFSYSKGTDPTTPQAQAVRAIGTNAIPWLLSDLKRGTCRWQERLNQLLQKTPLTKCRFPADRRMKRAYRGFYALGPLAEPAIPSLLDLLEANPDGISAALAGIGTPALPALQQCLTNSTSYKTSVGRLAPIPGSTIGSIYNAMVAGRISKPEAAIFLPAIRDWAKSTNNHAAAYATNFLASWHLSLSADHDTDELAREWR